MNVEAVTMLRAGIPGKRSRPQQRRIGLISNLMTLAPTLEAPVVVLAANSPNAAVPLRGTVLRIEVGDELRLLPADPVGAIDNIVEDKGPFEAAGYDLCRLLSAGDGIGNVYMVCATEPLSEITRRFPAVVEFRFRGVIVQCWFAGGSNGHVQEQALASAEWFVSLLRSMSRLMDRRILSSVRDAFGLSHEARSEAVLNRWLAMAKSNSATS